jgi:hypothetical protein
VKAGTRTGYPLFVAAELFDTSIVLVSTFSHSLDEGSAEQERCYKDEKPFHFCHLSLPVSLNALLIIIRFLCRLVGCQEENLNAGVYRDGR